MSEPAPTPPPAPAGDTPPTLAPTPPAPPPAPTPPTGDTPTDWEAEAEKWKALARKHERGQLDALGLKSKEELDQALAARAKLAEIEEQGKTEAQKALDAAAAAEARATEAEQKLLRLEVAAAKGIPATEADLLTGATRAEMEAVADRLAGLIQPAAPPRPTGSADGGPQGAPPNGVVQLTRADLKNMSAAEIVAAGKAGQLDDLKAGNTNTT